MEPIWDPLLETSGDPKPPFAAESPLLKRTKSPDFITFVMFQMLKTAILAILAPIRGYPRQGLNGAPFGTPFGPHSGAVQRGSSTAASHIMVHSGRSTEVPIQRWSGMGSPDTPKYTPI